MPEKKSPHLWIWIIIILLVVIVLVVVFVIRDQKSFEDGLSSDDFLQGMTVPEYQYSEEDRIRIEQEIAESNALFMQRISGNASPVESDENQNNEEYMERVRQHNESFMQLFQ